ncbi:MAG: hypothetical protein E7354_02095 [Clostridiales bacterium]|nr:hypothetical protein [Clostridiales bacterium]
MAMTNICIVGLTKLFTDEVCKELSSRLEMFYANVDDLLEYELIDKVKVEEVCGKEYLIKEELSVIRRVCSFDNTIINIDYINLNNDTALEYVKGSCVLIYLELPRERFRKELEREEQSFNQRIISVDLFEDRDFVCKGLADIIVPCDELDLEGTLSKINEMILDYYS